MTLKFQIQCRAMFSYTSITNCCSTMLIHYQNTSSYITKTQTVMMGRLFPEGDDVNLYVIFLSFPVTQPNTPSWLQANSPCSRGPSSNTQRWRLSRNTRSWSEKLLVYHPYEESNRKSTRKKWKSSNVKRWLQTVPLDGDVTCTIKETPMPTRFAQIWCSTLLVLLPLIDHLITSQITIVKQKNALVTVVMNPCKLVWNLFYDPLFSKELLMEHAVVEQLLKLTRIHVHIFM